MKKKLVSVIVPVYNNEKFVEECLDSISKQTYKNIEIICINDGSTDGSLKVLERYKEKEPRLKIYTTKNKGQGFARNFGLQKSQGDFVCFIDSDDYISNNMIEIQTNMLTRHQSDIAITLMECFFPDGKKYSCTYDCFTDEATAVPILLNPKNNSKCINFTNAAPCMFRSKFLKNKNIKFLHMLYEDWPFMIEALCKTQRISFINKVYYFYRRNFSQTTTSIVDMRCLDLIKAYQIAKELIKNNNLQEVATFTNDRKIILEGISFIKNRLVNAKRKVLYTFLKSFSSELNKFNETYYLCLINGIEKGDRKLLQKIKNNNFSIFFNPYRKKIKKHFNKFISPIKIFLKLIFQILSVLKEAISVLVYVVLFTVREICWRVEKNG